MKEITELITTVGFPIVACGTGFYFGGKFIASFVNRVMDENKSRETQMFTFMATMGEKMEKMSENMENLGEMIQKHIDSEHKEGQEI